MAELLPEITRVISGKGVITLPEDYFSALQIVLYAQIKRKPRNRSANLTWNPDKTFYAHITFCFNEFVLYEFGMNFDNQMWVIHDGQDSQNLLSLICVYDGILDSLASIGAIIGTVLSRVNLVKSHPYLRFVPNRIRFECFSDSAIVLTLKGTALAKCDPQDGDNTPPPPPPPPVPPTPPGTPVEVSPPEDGGDDGGDTVPFPIDLPPDPPATCGDFDVTYEITQPNAIPPGSSSFQQTIRLGGNVFAAIAEPFTPSRGVVCFLIGFGVVDEECILIPPQEVFNGGREGTTITLISSVPV